MGCPLKRVKTMSGNRSDFQPTLDTALAIQQTNDQIMTGAIDQQSLILPNKREVLLMKLNKLKTNNLSAKEQKDYEILTRQLTDVFMKLCWSKLGVSKTQLKQLEQQDLNELTVIIFEQSRTWAFTHTGILTCIPIIGWLTLLSSLQDIEYSENNYWWNMRYYWWYRRMKNKYGQDFKPVFKL